MKLFMLLNILFSITLMISSNNLILMWITMELNLLSFIPIMIKKNYFKFNSIILTKYFMIQSFSSMLFLMIFMFMYMNNYKYINNMMNLMLMIIILMKMGMPPFMYWYINLMKLLNWINCIIMSILQKIIPIIIFMKFIIFNKLIYLMLIIWSFFSIFYGMKQTMLKLMLTYSSINHMSWMLLLMNMSEKFLIKYYLLYSIISIKLMLMFNYIKLNFINEMMNMKNKFLMLIIMINILSLGGLPPLMGFIMKWFPSMIILNNKMFLLIMSLMMINSTFTIMYYLNILIPFMFINSYLNKFKFYNIKMNMIIIMMMFTSMYWITFNSLL
uniref:NADH-ubiquinone oxidoreductase chain 2 n=1 Tax=Platygaster sp. ZJUH_2016026 TaxID=2491166 RepID=A0A3S8V110_9HYME|nr:NADH dehydrogenase subunit 2 [Platygaster sp. ZJUH_2016026]